MAAQKEQERRNNGQVVEGADAGSLLEARVRSVTRGPSFLIFVQGNVLEHLKAENQKKPYTSHEVHPRPE